MAEWFAQHQTWLTIATVVSIALFFGTLAAIPVMVIRWPDDHFVKPAPQRQPWVHVLRVVASGILIAAGVAMLVLPGQGLLTILIGLTLLDFPAKRNLERRILTRPHVLHALNKIRAKAHRPPLRTS